MNTTLILWFGKTEKETQAMTKDWMYDNIKNNHIKEVPYWNPECTYAEWSYKDLDFEWFKKDFEKYQKEIWLAYKTEDDKQIKDRAERYYHINFSTLAYGYWTIFIRIKFWHINSKHPFSPDWIALLQETKTYSFDLYDFD